MPQDRLYYAERHLGMRAALNGQEGASCYVAARTCTQRSEFHAARLAMQYGAGIAGCDVSDKLE